MSTNKFIMLTIAAYFGMFGLVSNFINAEEITLDQIVGHWYTVGIIAPSLSKVSLRCDRRNITKGPDDTFNDVHTVITDVLHTYNGVGRIKGSELHITYPAFGPGYVDVIKCLKSYDNGEEFILHKAKPKQSLLLSRKPTASDEVRAIFEKEAADANTEVRYIDQDNC
ncbi:hypothetical protein PV327_010723 [Microctonus hyperodae]|uniref:Uncharacterized protein n=1 Tax=Microctonus hyperodae TaxID=165561 RepID=A0AA39F1E4_MICHY|nr:hypothetical protein PV327_010723 [Microctonus hyperodae]